jgi:hypothetical protein
MLWATVKSKVLYKETNKQIIRIQKFRLQDFCPLIFLYRASGSERRMLYPPPTMVLVCVQSLFIRYIHVVLRKTCG